MASDLSNLFPARFNSFLWIKKISPGAWFSSFYFLALLPWLGKNRLLGLDESFYANVAKAEVRDHHWLPLYFLGRPYWEKPPLLHWLHGLSLGLGGPPEASLRIWSALAGAWSLYFIYRLASQLAGGPSGGVACALLLGLQKHFILYSRLATMDMALLCCLLGSWWKISQALDSPHSQAGHPLLRAGLWLAAGILVKAWFGLVLLPAAGIVLYYRKPWPFSKRQLFALFFLPGLTALLGWLAAYASLFGKSFWDWEWNHNVSGRFFSGGWSSPENTRYHLDFYADLTRQGFAYLWPLLPLGLFSWVRAVWEDSRRKRFDPLKIIGVFFFFYYLFFILWGMATLINYLLPLSGAAAVGLGFLFRSQGKNQDHWAAVSAFLLAMLNGLTDNRWASLIFPLSFAPCLFPLNHFLPGLKPFWFRAGAVTLMVTASYGALDYWRHPPDPNHAWVATVLAHPARYPGEPLIFVGENTDARALEFYCDYRIQAVDDLPRQRPNEAILFGHEKEAVFFPALR
ncbi:MAG TPA: glycosyltransferase family 39 protein [bacterium]|nr:glycosyltransferase family 39 protein [bacterium]